MTTDTRDPDYDSSAHDALEAEVLARLPEITAKRMLDAKYADCWAEGIVDSDDGFKLFQKACSMIHLRNDISVYSAHRIIMYFSKTYTDHIKRGVEADMDKIREEVAKSLEPDYEPDGSSYEEDFN